MLSHALKGCRCKVLGHGLGLCSIRSLLCTNGGLQGMGWRDSLGLLESACRAGWSFKRSGLDVRREGNVAIYGVPYSEHSSFAELRACVKSLRPRKVIPTVNASTPAAARALVDRQASASS
jgi:DNA cross-link repair 1A protein